MTPEDFPHGRFLLLLERSSVTIVMEACHHSVSIVALWLQRVVKRIVLQVAVLNGYQLALCVAEVYSPITHYESNISTFLYQTTFKLLN